MALSAFASSISTHRKQKAAPSAMPNARLAALATMTLTEIITGERLEIARHGKGRSGRTLGYTRVSGADVGEVLIRAHVAVRWGNGRPDWCAVNAVAELRSPMTDAVEK